MTAVHICVGKGIVRYVGLGLLQSPLLPVLFQIRKKVLTKVLTEVL